MKRPTQNARKTGGFVLVLTLWIIAIVAIAASYFAEKVSSAVELAQKTRQNTQTAIDMASSRSEILYRLATTSLTVDGLGHGNTVIAPDNRPYHAIGDTLFQVQDSRGLINLNQTPDDRLMRFFSLMGIPAEQHGRLIDTLRDYIDPDSLERLNGAEKEQYQARGLPPPANDNLVTPWEARSIIGWRDTPQIWQTSQFIEFCTTSTVLGLNPNTAPYEVLATLPGMTNQLARSVIELRSKTPILNQGQFAAITGIPEQYLDMQIFVIPGDTLRITQTAPTLHWALRYSVSLTPNSDTAPWRIDYFIRVDAPPPLNPANNPADLPPRSTAPPDQSPAMRFNG